MRNRTRIKICGVTTPEEATLLVEAGVDAIGLIFADSPRRVSFERAREILAVVPAFVCATAVFVDAPLAEVREAMRIGCVPQFAGDETPAYCAAVEGSHIKVFHVGDSNDRAAEIERFAERYPCATLLFDSQVGNRRGGTGLPFAWEAVRPIAQRRHSIVAGGLTPENVADCVRQVRPYAVDVRSGVEVNGRKDGERVAAFVRAVRETDAQA